LYVSPAYGGDSQPGIANVLLKSLETQRLHIRALHPEDLPGFHSVWGDPEVIRWGADANLVGTRARLKRSIVLGETLPVPQGWAAVIEKASGVMVGDVVLQPAPFYPGEVELGYHFARRGQHAALRRRRRAPWWSTPFAVSSLPRVVAAIARGNVSSLKVAARLGMRKVAEVMHAGLRHDLLEVYREKFQATR
jgi:RimJ/RimL family protein N-acetyltransferase